MDRRLVRPGDAFPDSEGIAVVLGDRAHHFVVVRNRQDGLVSIEDPFDATTYEMTSQAFEAIFTGVFLWRKRK